MGIRTVALAVAGFAAFGLGFVLPTGAGTHDPYVERNIEVELKQARALPDCESEDTAFGPCFWDASVRGNGEGVSLVVGPLGEVKGLKPSN